MQLYLIRHGETKWNREKRYYGRTDLTLNEKGIQQAKQVGQLLKDLKFDKVYVSPLIRAKQTLHYICGENQQKERMLKAEVKETTTLLEQSLGIFEGFTYEELGEKFPEKLYEWNRNWKQGAPEGESFERLYRRVQKFCQRELELEGIGSENGFIKCRNPEQDQKKILIVSHEGVLRCLMILFLKMKEDSIWNFTFYQGAYSRIDLEDGYAILRKVNESGY